MSDVNRDPMNDPIVFDLTPRGAWAKTMDGSQNQEEAEWSLALATQAASIATALLAQEQRVANLLAYLAAGIGTDNDKAFVQAELRRLLHFRV
jgi:hypothetical protein